MLRGPMTLEARSIVGLLCALAAGCVGPVSETPDAAVGSDAAAADAGAHPAIARFAPSTDPMGFGDVPFPSDLYLGADGHVSLADLPIETADSAGLDALRVRLERETGFCTICGTHFYIDGDVDPASVPASVSASATAAVVLADVDPSSSERGRLFPLEVQWLPSAGRLSVRPPLGVALHRERTYAVALTSQVRGVDGAPVAATAAFVAARDGTGVGDPAVMRARTVLAPALAELTRVGVDVTQVVALAVFTTHDPTDTGLAVREAVQAAATPSASVDFVYPNATMSLDQLLGVPATTGFGGDLPELGGVAGERGLPHTSTRRIVIGSFESVRVIEGAGAELGTLHRDAAGVPRANGSERIPFVLIVPTGADVTNLPVAIFAHGHPRTMEDALMLADTLGASQIAVLAYDAFQHGGRSVHPTDTLLARGAAGADGFFEHVRTDVQTRIYAIGGTPTGFSCATVYREGTFAQILADAHAVVRFAVSGDLSAIAAADAALTGLAFDTDHVFVIGNSFGTVSTSWLLTLEPDLDAAVLNVSGGDNIQNFLGSALARGTAEGLLGNFGVRGRFDETSRRTAFEPMLDMVVWALSPFDAHALAPYAFLEPVVSGPRPDVLFQSAELDEFVPVWGAEGVVASMGVPRLGPFDFVSGVPVAPEPVVANLATPTGPVTAVAHLYPGASHLMLASNATTQSFAAPIIPPFRRLASTQPITEPTTAVHLEIRTFLSRHVMNGHGYVD